MFETNITETCDRKYCGENPDIFKPAKEPIAFPARQLQMILIIADNIIIIDNWLFDDAIYSIWLKNYKHYQNVSKN